MKPAKSRFDQCNNQEFFDDTGYIFICGCCGARYGSGAVIGPRELELRECYDCTARKLAAEKRTKALNRANAEKSYRAYKARLEKMKLERVKRQAGPAQQLD